MIDNNRYPLLSLIHDPSDLRKLSQDCLPKLAVEMRQYMIEVLDQCGGHFGANMGSVELAIALHFVYQTPDDRIVWDVGHQAYPHKILTGRRDQLHTIRQTDGLSPFPKRNENPHDCFGTGHSSTSISAALGMAVAQTALEPIRRCIAVIGDGGLTGGMAFEALNHGGSIDPDLLVILNDNNMSISKNVGALTHYFSRILSSRLYTSFRESGKKMLSHLPPLSKFAKKTETHLKGMVVPGSIFEELGFNYIGPIDGHHLPTLIKTLQTLKSLKGAKLLHVITTKGKGFTAAEADPIGYHAVKPGFYSKPPQNITNTVQPMTYSGVFGEWLCNQAKEDSRLIAITPAMCEGSGMNAFAKQFPHRYFDVGIAEQHSVTFAAGLACEGKKPVVAIYSTFLQRAYDQVIHDVAMQNLDVTFAIDRAGLVGGDGPTHAGSFDLTFLRCIPNFIVMAPSNENECYQMLNTAYDYPGPAAVRYPRDQSCAVPIQKQPKQLLPIGKAVQVRQGEQVAILAFGTMVKIAIDVAQKLNASVINMRFIKPLDEEIIIQLTRQYELLVTIEENTVMGGAGSAVNECLAKHGIVHPILNLGLPDLFIDHGLPQQQREQCGLQVNEIIQKIKKRLLVLSSADFKI